MSRRSRDRVGARLATALVAATLVLSACDATSAESGSDPTPSSSGSGAGDSPSVAPAHGKLVDTSWFSVHVPRGWRVNETVPDLSIVAFGPDLEQISLSITQVAAGHDFTLGELARVQLQQRPWSPKPELVDPVELAGEPAYHLTGPVGNGFRADAFGLAHGDREVFVDIETRGSARVQQETVDAVLASWQWK